MMRFLRLLGALLLLPVPFILGVIPWLACTLADLGWWLFGRRRLAPDTQPATGSASVVIPNWNGRDLLERYLPSVIEAMSDHPGNEIIVVDNGSTDGSAAFVQDHFPSVRLLALPVNLGFGGGANAGFRAARNDIVVLLNSDMRVDRHFLAPLLAGFTNARIFAVACQIFFSDPHKLREETGLTQFWWEAGTLRVRHRIDEQVTDVFPCAYGGGGSCAFDRRKFLALGGFDELLRPFYLEDTDLGYLAWKRGWQVLYQPRSIVYHEHRGTIGRKFSPAYIQTVLQKNFLLFCWKNIHEWPRLSGHFGYAIANAAFSLFAGHAPQRTNWQAQWRALMQLPAALSSRWRARQLSAVSDTEAFARPLAGTFRDRFVELSQDPQPLRVLFVSPYPICPPVHGGAVFMYQTVRELLSRCELHAIVLLDFPRELAAHAELQQRCASAEFIVRLKGTPKGLTNVLPHAVVEFTNDDLLWLIHRQIYNHRIDILQLEYTHLSQYAGPFQRLGNFLFEHDIYFQSIGRGLPYLKGWPRIQASFEYLRALRFELTRLPRFDRIQVCSQANEEYLTGFLPALRGRLDAGVRAGIQTADYDFQPDHRLPDTLLFLGSFRHLPNQEGMHWFARYVLPLVVAQHPAARLTVIGSDPPERHALPGTATHAIDLRGFVSDIRQPLREYAIFICPILSGSGVRVKLLEAFAAGIPVVSTRLGAEGLSDRDGEICLLADDPAEFAARILALLNDPDRARALAVRARRYVERERDMSVMTDSLVQSYRSVLANKRRNNPV